MSKKGTFICFEGLDGSGKTSAAKLFANYLADMQQEVVYIEKKDTNFGTPYLTQHMKKMKSVLWDFELHDPLHELGDMHWLFLMATWFSVIDHVKVRNLISEGKIVVLDNWYFKFAARYRLKQNIDFKLVEKCFSSLSQPDLVVMLDIEPAIAASRKTEFSLAETGNMDGLKGHTVENFIKYQQSVREVLRTFENQFSSAWVTIPVDQKNINDVVTEAVLKFNSFVKDLE